MKSFVVLSCVLAVAVASYVPADTPEVAAAKAQHFAAHQQAQARNWASDVVVNNQWVAAAPAWSNVWTARAANWYAPSWQRWYEPAQITVVNGHVQDTPEVAAEKAKHFALVAEANARNAVSGGEDGQWVDDVNVRVAAPAVAHVAVHAAQPVSYVKSYVAPAVSHSYVAAARHVQPANIVVANGHVQDTPEVAAEKAKHFALYAESAARNAAAGSTEWADNAENWKAWGSPAAVSTYAAVAPVVSSVYPSWAVNHQVAPIVVANGHVQDTAEVAAEKAKHLAQVAEAKARNAVSGGEDGQWVDDVNVHVAAPAVAHVAVHAAQPVSYVKSYVAPAVSHSFVAAARHVQPANIVVANGHVQDTAEVAAEKAKHLALVAEAKARNGDWSEVVAPVAVAPVAPVAVAPVAVGRVAHAVAAVPAVADLHSQYHAQDEAGQYTYGYNGGLSTKNEEKTVDGVTRGAYSYVDANGIVQSRSYVADSFGFRVAATDLPQDAPAVAAAPIVAAPVHTVYAAPAVYQRVATAVPAQVVVKADGTLQDTPEVAAAKAQHFAAHQQEHARLAGGAW